MKSEAYDPDGHIYACNPLLISNTAKSSIPDDLYKILVDTANEVRDWQRELVLPVKAI